MRIVTAAAGRRDGYQVPVALVEAGLLERHVTDLYLPDWLEPLLVKRVQRSGAGALSGLSRRHHPQLSSRWVHCSRRLLFTQLAQRFSPALREEWSDDQDPISWSALRLAQHHDAALLLHMGYAHHAFTGEPRERRRRGLVQYHPHIRESARILQNDLERYPVLSDAREELRIDVQDHSNQEELERADLVICNSSFSARTCQMLGVEPQRLRVIPFGIDPLPLTPASPSGQIKGQCRFLFVGSGLHRKGLHHLLDAWKQARLRHSQLTLVCRHIDPQIRSNFSLSEGMELRSAVSHLELERLYRISDVFVMPSLVEGFGYVYLEALSRGCFCLGTANTGLPDVADAGSAKLVPPANPSALAQAMQEVEARALTKGFDRRAIAAVAQPWSWTRFRQDLVAASRELLP